MAIRLDSFGRLWPAWRVLAGGGLAAELGGKGGAKEEDVANGGLRGTYVGDRSGFAMSGSREGCAGPVAAVCGGGL